MRVTHVMQRQTKGNVAMVNTSFRRKSLLGASTAFAEGTEEYLGKL